MCYLDWGENGSNRGGGQASHHLGNVASLRKGQQRMYIALMTSIQQKAVGTMPAATQLGHQELADSA